MKQKRELRAKPRNKSGYNLSVSVVAMVELAVDIKKLKIKTNGTEPQNRKN